MQVLGLTEKPSPGFLTGIVAHSGGPITAEFASSSPVLDRVYQNILWSQRSNYFETMTDCPQRDERYGWTGDAHFCLPTSAYNQRAASFFHKYFLDLVDTQRPETGNISDGAPGWSPGGGVASLEWSAAMVVTPWTIWRSYGDTRPMEENYAALRRYMEMWREVAEHPDRMTGPAFSVLGDWVAQERGTSKEFIGRVMGYVVSRHMSEIARVLGKKDDAATFADLAETFRGAVLAEYVKPDGTVDGDTQTAYAYAARLGLYPPELEDAIRSKFSNRMAEDHHGVLTGFHGTGNLLQGLTEIGLNADAGETILSEAFPGWGNMVKRGATTIWERWDGKDADGDFFDPTMNSFNHYTFGGCGEWMMGYLVGLRNQTPGFKTVRVEPAVIAGLDMASGSFESPYGRVANRWERRGGRIEMRLEVPPNSDARVVLPAGAEAVTLAGESLTPLMDGTVVGSGTHEFSWDE